MWKLVIEDDESKRTVVPLTRDDYTIGRQEGNTIRLTERNVSRSHGRIRRKRVGGNGQSHDVFVIEDRQSYNGVFVNGLRVAHIQDLQHGDLIQIGDYRIVLHDDAASVVETAAMPVSTTEPDAKATIPIASQFRHHAMTERPNRLVMLVGPTPGVEYPLDRDRMSIGRAEDSSISVNHNSVSRLHCEVHALGDGRFEIVDKGSSNGVRVNAVELKRSIIEAGDVIELGDVRFKFVGAGQVFVPGPNESQQLTAISDREAELVDTSKRGWGGYVIPVIGAGVVGACMILAFVYVLRGRAQADTPPIGSTPTAAVDPEQALVKDAKEKCSPDDCETSHVQINTLPTTSQMREHPDFRFIENTWARSIIDKAKRGEGDKDVRRLNLQRVERAQTVDATLRTEANKAIADLEEPGQNPSQLPTAQRDAGTTVTSAVVPPPPATTARPAPLHTTPGTSTATVEKPTPTPSAKPVQDLSGAAGKLLADGNCSAVRSMLEKKVQNGTANPDELRQYNMAVHNANRPDKGCTH